MKRLLVMLVVLLLAAAAAAQTFPARPITFTVPWSPGGGTDTTSRTLAAVLTQSLDVNVNVVNRTGGGGVVGHLALAQAPANGYTIGAITVEITMLPHIGQTTLSYVDYTPLGLMINNPSAVTVRADAPWDTLDELLDHIRANPGELQASGTAMGGIWDLARIGLLLAADLDPDAMPWVPSQGAAPAFQELLAGGVDVVTAALAEAASLLGAGEVKVLGVMSPNRVGRFPDVPTLRELGYDWSIGGWAAVAAPAGLPADVRATLADAIEAAMASDDFIDPLTAAGFTLQPMNADEFSAFIQEQHEVNGRLLEIAGVTEE
ncbi:MAG: tripartite tricarboxylate transporter substrate binding protein [Trueperaceae bacterium]|nr:tripartite tricarboxylate transporter substrate binding protein [Trueperaceae bacterium]